MTKRTESNKAAAQRAALKPITDLVKNAPSPIEMLQLARQAGKSESAINAFAATQPTVPVAIKGRRVFVQDCFGRVFGLDTLTDAEIQGLIASGVPYTAYSNRRERRAAVRQNKLREEPATLLKTRSAGLSEQLMRRAKTPEARGVARELTEEEMAELCGVDDHEFWSQKAAPSGDAGDAQRLAADAVEAARTELAVSNLVVLDALVEKEPTDG